MNRREVLGAGLATAGLLGPSTARAMSTIAEPIELQRPSALSQGGWARLRCDPRWRLTLDAVPVPIGTDGLAFVAFDRDSAPQARLRAEPPNGGDPFTLPLTIAPRQWQIEHINLSLRPGVEPDAEFLRRRADELAQINAARAQNRASDGWRQAMVWPLLGRLSGRFGSQRIYRGTAAAYHSGLDIARASGVPFVAPADGVVVLAATDPFTLEGHLLLIDHGMGLNSAFLHCSEHAVRLGDTVRQGQFIGRVGMTGRATGPHLHWSMKWQSARLDPLLFLGPMPNA